MRTRLVFYFQSNSRKRKQPKDAVELEIIRQLQRDANAEDENDLFGQSVGIALKKLEPQKRALAKIKIQEILFNLEFDDIQ